VSERALDRLMIVLAAAVVGVVVFGAVLALVPKPPSPDVVAAEVLDAAHEGIDKVDAQLPDGGTALVAIPGGPFEIIKGKAPALMPDAVVPWLSGQNGATAVAAGGDSTWAAVAVPDGGSATMAGLVAALVAALGVLAMPLLLNHRRPKTVMHVQQADPRLGPMLDERATLVKSLIELLPQLPDGVAWQAENALAKAGVHQIVPDGELVDPQRHHVVGTEPPADLARVNTVARTIRPGYADGDRLVIHPKVVVYAMDQAR
jgi:GrpE